MTAVAASGIFKQVRYATESTFGAAASGGGTSQQLRRVTSQLNPEIATFRSNEIQPDRQVHTFRHGTQQVKGTMRGELSPATYKDFFASLLAGTFTAGVSSAISATSVNLTYTAPVAGSSAGTITRASGSWITDGFKIGDVIRITGSGVAANNSRNFRVTALVALTMTVGPVPPTGGTAGNETLAAGTDSSGTVTFAVIGKKLATPNPSTGGTLQDPSFTYEHWYSDVAQSEVYTGVKPTAARLGIQPNGLCTVDFDWMGYSYQTGTSAYFSSPTAVTTSNSTVGTSGILRLEGKDLALVTNLQMNIQGGHTSDPVVGSLYVPFIFPGIIDVSGSMTALFFDQTQFTDAINENAVELYIYLTLSSAINPDFLMIKTSNLRLNAPTKDDGPKAIMQSLNFQAVKQLSGGTGTVYDDSTIVIQDSLA